GHDQSALDGFDLEQLKIQVWAALENEQLSPQLPNQLK
ncbi:MAG: hypothetical protein RLZZ156_2826, partial [Deinococcota bacterium]